MYEKEMSLLKKLKYLIKKNPMNAKKIMLISDFDSLVNILQNLGLLYEDYQTVELGDDYEFFFKKLKKEFSKYENTYLDNIEMISKITDDLRIFNAQHSFIVNSDVYSKHVSIKDMNEILIEFILGLDKDFYNLFSKMISERHIVLTSNSELLGSTYAFNCSTIPYILIKDINNNFQKYVTFIHEFGHCYELYYNQANLGLTHNSVLSEVSSLSLEYIFLNYLIENNIYMENAINEKIRWRKLVSLMNSSVCFSNYALLNNLATIDEEDGSIITDSSLYFDFALDNELLDSSLEFEPSILNYRYVLSDIVANYFARLYKNNPKEGLSVLRQYIMTSFQSDLKDVLEKYGDLSATKEEIEKIIKYQHRR